MNDKTPHEKPNNLPNHRYFMSVLVAYRSACRTMRCLSFTWAKSSDVCVRVNDVAALPFLQHDVQSGALDELDALMELLVKAAPTCRNAANNIDIVRKLQTKAFEASNHMVPQPDMLPLPEVDRLSGGTHFASAQPDGGVLLNRESLSTSFRPSSS
ncbi:hypothetical protein C8J56DRAFT_1054722 [Mycena floridula]|nr:hypothetical protein C8J56DRAFT_1054722 [Mycena floridula]